MIHDHEHPCPTEVGCIESLRRGGLDVPNGTDCCICWSRDHVAEWTRTPTIKVLMIATSMATAAERSELPDE